MRGGRADESIQRRREALERIQSAGGELEQRIGEVEAQDQHLRDLQQRLDRSVSDTVSIALGMFSEPQANAA